MRDGATGRSRGFGFLTFRDPKVVNTVMVKEHFLDGKIVRVSISDKSSGHPSKRNATRASRFRRASKKDPYSPWTPFPGYHDSGSLQYDVKIDPKRAIPRDEQEKTSKIFVGGVSQEATEQDFKEFFQQFGRVVDATLMMDKDTGRPRGFGFVTFDSEAAVEKCLDQQPLEILGKMIEVKKAQPRGKMGEEEDNRGRGRGRFGRGEDRYNDGGGSQSQQGGQNAQQSQSTMASTGAGGMTPQMMAQYWQRMQQYFAMMQQQMAASAMGGGMGGMGMNPQMMAQMAQMQQMQQMQKQMQQNQQQGSMSPAPQSPGGSTMGGMSNMQGMTPQMQQQMMQMMQNQQQQQGGMGGFGMGGQNMGGSRPGFNAQEQMAFEQQKYEQQLARQQQGFQRQPHAGSGGNFNQQQQQAAGGPTSWEGMYDDVPQPNAGGRASAGVVRNLTPMNGGPGKAPKGPQAAAQPSNAPANAPTGPKNAGKPGSNFRGGRGGRFHPYGR
jgi:RNA-binding protein Musashi